MMSRGMSRADRLREMERLYVQRPFSDIEMAERLGIKRSTVWKDRQVLEGEVPFAKDEAGRWYIDRHSYLSAIRVNLHEALALYLAARRVSGQTKFAQKHVANALSKLAATLQKPMTEKLVKAAELILNREENPTRTAVLETIAIAWVQGKKIHLTYQALDTHQPVKHLVSPFLIEPALWSDSTYLIGLTEVTGQIIPFKVERIQQAHLALDSFTWPVEFDEFTLLKHAWGIWYSTHKPVLVQLKFAPGRATRRLKETIWHPSEKVEELADGGCLWAVEVQEWQEMLPWIRGWGADCEVLAPRELRETLKGEVRAMAQQYGWFVSSSPHKTSTVDDFFGG